MGGGHPRIASYVRYKLTPERLEDIQKAIKCGAYKQLEHSLIQANPVFHKFMAMHPNLERCPMKSLYSRKSSHGRQRFIN
jgi:hypothetical protein